MTDPGNSIARAVVVSPQAAIHAPSLYRHCPTSGAQEDPASGRTTRTGPRCSGEINRSVEFLLTLNLLDNTRKAICSDFYRKTKSKEYIFCI